MPSHVQPFPAIPAVSSDFQLFKPFTAMSSNFKIFPVISAYFSPLQLTSSYFSLFQPILIYSSLFQPFPDYCSLSSLLKCKKKIYIWLSYAKRPFLLNVFPLLESGDSLASSYLSSGLLLTTQSSPVLDSPPSSSVLLAASRQDNSVLLAAQSSAQLSLPNPTQSWVPEPPTTTSHSPGHVMRTAVITLGVVFYSTISQAGKQVRDKNRDNLVEASTTLYHFMVMVSPRK